MNPARGRDKTGQDGVQNMPNGVGMAVPLDPGARHGLKMLVRARVSEFAVLTGGKMIGRQNSHRIRGR